jgi:cell division protein FtsQ
LKVTVEAQRPAAMLKASDDSLTAVDSRGRVLNAVDGTSADGIPVIEVANVDTGLQNRAVKEALKILNSLPEQMRTSITKVSAQTQDSVTTELDSGNRIIVWGDSSDLKLKKAVVDKIINDPTKIGDKHQVDVSAPLRPIIK